MAEYLECRYDKFIFKVKTGYLYSKDDFWVKPEGNKTLVGLSDFLQKVRGDVAFLETADVGAVVKQGQAIGTIETIKATFEILSPVSGTVIEINPELESSPNLINDSCYDAGWIYRIELKNYETEKSILLQAEAYFDLMKEKISEEMKKK
jgi:glycine cleavage system H protein